MKKTLISLLIVFVLFISNINGNEYEEITSDCVSTCYVYCEVPADFSVTIPTNGIGECEVNGNVDVEITATNDNPIIYKIETL